MDDLGVLRWFVQIAEGSSFTATAAQFGVSPAAVSQGIAKLERELGTRLFNRTTRRLHLTSEGQLFLTKVKSGLDTLDSGAALLRDAQLEPNGVLHISTVSSFGKEYFMGLMAEFLKRYPKISVELAFIDEDFDLVQAGIDVAVRRVRLSSHNYVSRKLCDLPLVLVASPDYLERRSTPHTPEDLMSHDWIGCGIAGVTPGSLELQRAQEVGTPPQHGALTETDVETVEVRHRPNRITVSEQLDAAVSAVTLGMGVSFFSLHLVLPHLRSGKLKLLLPEYRVRTRNEIHVVYPHREYLTLKVRAFIDFLSERLTSDPDLRIAPSSLAPFVAR